MILSALFALGAHVQSVTAKQVTDLLKLNMGANARDRGSTVART
jgi:hypothetical protein